MPSHIVITYLNLEQKESCFKGALDSFDGNDNGNDKHQTKRILKKMNHHLLRECL